MSEQYVQGYEGEPRRKKVKLVTEEYEYELPFNYENVTVNRRVYHGNEFHGMETNPINSVNDEENPIGNLPADSIEIAEDHPIIRVVVIGSACTPPGYIQIECEPIREWRRKAEMDAVMPVRMRINGLWGMHLRYDQWYAEGQIKGVTPEGLAAYEELTPGLLELYPWMANGGLKTHYREFPLTGMSCAIFEIPPSKNVIVMGGGETPGWKSDQFPDDAHYSFRMIRTTVQLNRG